MTKRVLTVLMSIAIMFSMLVVPASAATSGTCGDNLIWTLDDDGTLTISGTGEIDGYTFVGRTDIKSVIIGNGVTSIEDCAFDGCDSLTSVTIPDSVTNIGYSAFFDCDSLKSITIPDSVVSIGDWAFADCSSLTSITIGDGVTSIGANGFSGCSSLTSITIPDNVTSIDDYAFYFCGSLASVTIPDSVTSIGESVFGECSSDLVIYGYADGAAETYAKDNDITFVAMPELDTEIAEQKTFTDANVTGVKFNVSNSADVTVQGLIVKYGKETRELATQITGLGSVVIGAFIPGITKVTEADFKITAAE